GCQQLYTHHVQALEMCGEWHATHAGELPLRIAHVHREQAHDGRWPGLRCLQHIGVEIVELDGGQVVEEGADAVTSCGRDPVKHALIESCQRLLGPPPSVLECP